MEKKFNLFGIGLFLILTIVGITVGDFDGSFDWGTTENVIGLVLIVIGILGAVWCFLSITGKGVLAFIKTPGKISTKIKAYKNVKTNAKLDKALLKAHQLKILNAARQNPEFRANPKVNKIYSKLEFVESKKVYKESKNKKLKK